jgi:hypothetical protein
MGPWLVDVTDRSELDEWLAGGPPHRAGSSVMLVCGDEPLIRGLIPNALDAAKMETNRVVVWVKDSNMLSVEKKNEFFGKSDSVRAVVLDRSGAVGGWMTSDRISVDDAVFAFSEAEKSNG